MKRIFTFLVLMAIGILLTAGVFAQSPEKMSYQAVVRDANNNLVSNTEIGMQIYIVQGSVFGNYVYVERQTPTTNTDGMVTIEIGSGIVVTGDFTTVDWTDGPFFIKTDIDPTGGTSYTITGISQLLSVPYALHSKTAESITGTIPEVDGSVTNELQTLNLSNDTLTISDGNNIVLPYDSSYWKKNDNDIEYNEGYAFSKAPVAVYDNPGGSGVITDYYITWEDDTYADTNIIQKQANNYEFQVILSGWYRVSVNILFNIEHSYNGICRLRLNKNEELVSILDRFGINNTAINDPDHYVFISSSVLIHFNAGDIISMYLDNNENSSVYNMNNTYNQLSFEYLGK